LSEVAGDGAKLPFNLTAGGNANEITFERTDARKLQIVKKFTLPKAGAKQDDYAAQLDIAFTNHGDQPVTLPGYYLYTGSAAPMHQNDLPQYTGFGSMRSGKFVFKDSSAFQTGGFLFFGKTDAPVLAEGVADVAWAAVTNQYYTTIVTPTGVKGSGIWAHRFTVPKASVGVVNPGGKRPAPPPTAAAATTETLNAVEGALQLPSLTVAPGATVSHGFQVYTGPRAYQKLADLGGGQNAVMDFGMFKIVSITLLKSMNTLKGWLGSYALAIIVLTIIIRALMWPLQNKATQSMKNIAALQPRMNELKEKYPDDPTRQQQEIMKLYKQYNINPLMGCLPMLVQIPIFFGFYNMLGKAVELRNATFLGWVHDLSQPDTVGYLFGYPINILPGLMAVTMFVQMRISPKSGDAVQQRVFMFMPVIFIIFCYNYASALALYWSVQNLFSIVQLYITRDKITPHLQKVPATVTKKR
jgi:YidC/Oxa1 family membrane protein insertase